MQQLGEITGSGWHRREALLDHMSGSDRSDRIEPSVVSFNSATSSAMSASVWQMALLLWIQMPKQMIQPDTWHILAAYLGILIRQY